MADVNLQNNAGYTAMMLASLTAPDGPSGMEAVRRLMELGNTNIQSSQVTHSVPKYIPIKTHQLMLGTYRPMNVPPHFICNYNVLQQYTHYVIIEKLEKDFNVSHCRQDRRLCTWQ